MANEMPAPVQTINAASNKILPGNWAVKYIEPTYKTTQWMVIEVTRTTKGTGILSGSEYFFKQYIYSSTGQLISSQKLGSDIVAPVLGSTQAWRDSAEQNQPVFKKAKSLLETAVTLGQGDPTEGTVLNNTPVPNTELDQIRWNPFPHFITRSPSFYNLANINVDEKNQASQATIQKAYNAALNSKLGKIYQNKTSAAALNNKENVDPSKVKAGDLWGFRFLYNPTQLSYGSTIDTAIDWMLQPKDPSNFFGGNTVISFDLYLNRIADMKTLRDKGTIASSYPGGSLTDEQINGILKRGTEFDLEYLYRVVNGAPGQTTLVSDSTLLTSDFGYITGMPVWLQFHDNMRYKASLSSIQVTHAIFTESMIPVLSVVKLSFIRYPELDNLGVNKQKVVDSINTKKTQQ